MARSAMPWRCATHSVVAPPCGAAQWPQPQARMRNATRATDAKCVMRFRIMHWARPKLYVSHEFPRSSAASAGVVRELARESQNRSQGLLRRGPRGPAQALRSPSRLMHPVPLTRAPQARANTVQRLVLAAPRTPSCQAIAACPTTYSRPESGPRGSVRCRYFAVVHKRERQCVSNVPRRKSAHTEQ
jgi:hypothetical protein